MATPLIVITGPTASGKTALAIELAEKYDGEIVCADSRTVYKGLDVGTAKPTARERARVPHYLLDVVEPDKSYNLARFQAEATARIKDITARGKLPFLVGGSGLYIDSVILDYQLGTPPDHATRTALNDKTVDELLDLCKKNNVKLPENYLNKRYLIRAIEQGGVNHNSMRHPSTETCVIAIKNDNDTLKDRINLRADSIFAGGVVEETRRALERFDSDSPALRSPAYAAAIALIRGESTEEQAIASLARADWQLARKQMTWLRRHDWVYWLERDDAGTFLDEWLARHHRA